ncbi:uncharacterized protein BDR25DRAFT_303119 [Lindgomyces ingoldianus]|uniref:Uncharacterized protein n=1 Tax=Lindgomyces ingoldianus TaxID=673940 RepID=A0ACB6QX68_9PLEO|nr:uncharacterized protein BDR25DRAFT_303119 [Lindgomyces ingoldianus]KAF2471613.1 hypothetical protein BDR25DRAFT_303119 [Lindgomyces ingoldianus]
MMLAASSFYTQNLYNPTRPSPLSERSANAAPRVFSFNMATMPQPEKKPTPQRAYKPNPVIQSRTGDAAKERRREMFFRKVQKGRDEKMWEVRGDQIQRLDFISSHKRWEAEKARQAPPLEDGYLNEDLLEEAAASWPGNTTTNPEKDMAEVDYVLEQEERELQALIALMEEEQAAQDMTSQHYGSDEEDYDQIFIEYTNVANVHQQDQQQPLQSNARYDDPDAMDTTEG